MSRIERYIASLGFCAMALRATAAAPALPDYYHDIAPLLKNRCVRCHGPAVMEGSLNLAVPNGVARGGESGKVIVLGKPEESLLWQRVVSNEMPEDEPLPADEKELLRHWIASGSPGLPANVSDQPKGDEHWAFQVLRPTAIPEPSTASNVRTPIDAFINSKLAAGGLSIGPDAEREILIRRVSFDLTGLPPTLGEIVTYLSDQSDTAYENMVERYLASPRYGERWGKYWLDTAGYADSNGYFNADTDRPLAYRYRDYVVRSINADKPWDQFIREQLAGDELAGYKPGSDVSPSMIELLEASHYLRNSPDGTDSSDGNPDELRTDKYAVLEGTMQIVGSSLLGLTVQCAKCHDHKFEPFTQRDYYALQSILYPAFNVEKWVKPKEREIVAATAAEIAAWETKSKAIDEQIRSRRQEFREWLADHRIRGRLLFHDRFDRVEEKLANAWSNAVPGDDAPAGQPAVELDSTKAPSAQTIDGYLRIVESGDAGDRVLSTKQVFDWTPNEKGAWIQATFDRLPVGDAAPYVGFFIALRDFHDADGSPGGNVLVDAATAGKATVHVDYPGADDSVRGQIGISECVPGHNYGVRVSKLDDNQFELALVVDGQSEEGTITLTDDDLPDGGFGFEYCCGRSFAVDNVMIESSDVALDEDPMHRQLAEQQRQMRAELEVDIERLEAEKGKPLPRLAPVYDLSAIPPDVFVLDRGDYKSPKEQAKVAAPHALSDATDHSLQVPPAAEGNGSTGRRLAFARWLTEKDSRAAALLARVTVNRIWQNHFGVGIVPTVENLGYSGAAPTHPELLDFLASEFVRSGWSAKAVHRLILCSATYRQSSRAVGNAEQVDPDNRLLGRFPLRRLDAEAIRDGMLVISGEFDLQMGGPYVATERDGEGSVIVNESAAGAHRRSIYLQQRRTQVPEMLQVFDAPSIVFSCPARSPTTVPLQSLSLLNSSFVRLRSKAFANRIAAIAGADFDERIRTAFLLVAGRSPDANEATAARNFVAEQRKKYHDRTNVDESAWSDFCQALLASNLYLYVE